MPVGVDEAGKGPVLGSMFAAAVAAPAEALKEMQDSKTLTSERRVELAKHLAADPTVSIRVAEVPVEEIDDPETDMNELTVAAHVRSLTQLGAEGQVVVDAGEVDADRFGRRVEAGLETQVSVTAEHGADRTHPAVAAASIIAKVSRDAHVKGLETRYDAPIGSGYPGDGRTRRFLANYVEAEGALPPCARQSWQTSADVLAAHEQATLEEF